MLLARNEKRPLTKRAVKSAIPSCAECMQFDAKSPLHHLLVVPGFSPFQLRFEQSPRVRAASRLP
jgi:hypothetical protein